MSRNKYKLRKVLYPIASGVGGIYGRDKYKLECGHEHWGTKGASRVRCLSCGVRENYVPTVERDIEAEIQAYKLAHPPAPPRGPKESE